MSQCLVTGGAGFIGSHLTEQLLAAGHEVVVLDDLSTGREANLAAVRDHPNFRFQLGSIADPVLLTDFVARADTIYHLAAAVGVKLVAEDPVRTIETNITPTEALLRLAAQGDKRLFLASTSEVYGKNPKEVWNEEDDLHFGPTDRARWAYGASKAIDEFLAIGYHRKFGLRTVIGRFFNVVGPRQVGHYGMVLPRFVDQALTGGPVTVYDDGGQIRCFGHVDEVVQCVIALTESDQACGEVVNIGSDVPVTVRELADAVIRQVDPSVEVVHVPYDSAYGENFEDVRRRVPELSKLERLLGFRPSRSLDDIIADVVRSKRDTSDDC